MYIRTNIYNTYQVMPKAVPPAQLESDDHAGAWGAGGWGGMEETSAVAERLLKVICGQTEKPIYICIYICTYIHVYIHIFAIYICIYMYIR